MNDDAAGSARPDSAAERLIDMRGIRKVYDTGKVKVEALRDIDLGIDL